MKVKEESEKVGLKLNIQKTKIMTSGPITSWLIDAEITETQWQTLFLGLQNHCRWWLQPWNEKTLASWKKSYDQPRKKRKRKIIHSCPTLCNPMDYGLPGSSVHEIFQERVLEWVAISFSNSILKSRDITLPTKVCLFKAMVFPVVMYECESWAIKKAECRRTDAFKLCCWRNLLRVPWTAKRSNQSILKKINPDCSLERLLLKLDLHYSGHLMRRAH